MTDEMTDQIFRQGDVLFVRVTSLPADAVPTKPRDGRIIVQEGEATGHHHSVAIADAELLTTDTAEQAEQWLRVHRETALIHQEHPAVMLPPGVYKRVPQVEYVPAALPQRVVD